MPQYYSGGKVILFEKITKYLDRDICPEWLEIAESTMKGTQEFRDPAAQTKMILSLGPCKVFRR